MALVDAVERRVEIHELGPKVNALVEGVDDSYVVLTDNDRDVAVVLAPERYLQLMADADTEEQGKFLVVLEQDPSGTFVVHCPSIAGCFSQGETEGEALDKIREAISGCIEARKSLNIEPATPAARVMMRRITP